MLDPLALHNGEVLKRKAGLIDHAQRAAALESAYKSDFPLLATASLVNAVEARLDRKPEMVNEALRQGFILAPFFSEQLAVYEKQEQAMRFFYPEMVKAIDLIKEDARLTAVEFASQAPVRQVQAAPAPPVLTGAAKTLEDGEEFLRVRTLEKAKQAFLQALQQTGENPLHAKAYYGLARVAALEKDPELAERLFQKTLESSPDAQVKAWTEVYLGRLADSAGERAQAVQHYRDALAVPGATEGARKAAEQGIQQTFQKQEK
jgi:tetratricopeptide (TPR) repeat protein